MYEPIPTSADVDSHQEHDVRGEPHDFLRDRCVAR